MFCLKYFYIFQLYTKLVPSVFVKPMSQLQACLNQLYFRYICNVIIPLEDTQGHFPFLKYNYSTELNSCPDNVILTMSPRENCSLRWIQTGFVCNVNAFACESPAGSLPSSRLSGSSPPPECRQTDTRSHFPCQLRNEITLAICNMLISAPLIIL